MGGWHSARLIHKEPAAWGGHLLWREEEKEAKESRNEAVPREDGIEPRTRGRASHKMNAQKFCKATSERKGRSNLIVRPLMGHVRFEGETAEPFCFRGDGSDTTKLQSCVQLLPGCATCCDFPART